MNCNYCQKTRTPQSTHYNITNVRERFNPTYSHTQIFNDLGRISSTVRCTPTFHSTALDVQGYQPSANQHLKTNCHKTCQRTVYKNSSKQKRQVDLDHHHEGYCNHNVEWYDPAKEKLFSSLTNCTTGYSRERKQADLSSNPVFGGNVMMPLQCGHCQHTEPVQCHRQEEEKCVEESKEPEVQGLIDPAIPKQEEITFKPIIKEPSQKEESIKQPETAKFTKTQPTKKKAASKTLGPQKYCLKNDVSLCTRGCSSGLKIAKTIVIGDNKPAYTIFRR